MSPSVVVVGSGYAGLAALFALAKRGISPVIVSNAGGGGASAISSGCADILASSRERVPFPDQGEREFLEALGWQYEAREGGGIVATLSGTLRRVSAWDSGILSFHDVLRNSPAPRRVAVVNMARSGWRGEILARSWNEEALRQALGLEFVSVELPWGRFEVPRNAGDVDHANSLDASGRAWLADRWLEHPSIRDACAIIAGPWLAASHDAIRDLSVKLGRPIGETLSPPGGAFGARFERRTDALIAQHASARVPGPIEQLERRPDGWKLTLQGGKTLDAEGIVLAVGGAVGGGIRMRDEGIGAPLELAMKAPLNLGVVVGGGGTHASYGGPIDGSTSRQWEWAGIPASASGIVVGVDGSLRVVGDLVADRVRSVSRGIRSALDAASSLAEHFGLNAPPDAGSLIR